MYSTYTASKTLVSLTTIRILYVLSLSEDFRTGKLIYWRLIQLRELLSLCLLYDTIRETISVQLNSKMRL
jgi:hypothetical protein